MALLNQERDDNLLDKIVSRRFKGNYLNDTKWVQLLQRLISESSAIIHCKVKLVWEGGRPYRDLLIDKNRDYNFDYYQSSMESMITGKPRGWYKYREIEWLDFPAASENGTQDLDYIAAVLASVGELEFDLDSERLRLYAYR